MTPHDSHGARGPKTGLRLRPLASITTPLFGRDADLAEVTRLLTVEGVRLLTLTGAGGTGKTRLASACAVAAAAEFAGGVSFVDLSVVTDPDVVPSSVAQALGIPESGTAPLELVLSDLLATRGLLLILDNFEQVIGAASFVARLVAMCPKLAVLVTSREPLHARAERVVPVRPLPVPSPGETDLSSVAANPAVALFVDRGRACRAGFSLTRDNAHAVAEICTRLDGLPLAIELAAAQLGVLSPAAILERLVARAPFLLRGVADLPDRHRTLRAAVASSYDLLAPAEQALFCWCGVFAGPFTVADAAAVYTPPDDRQVDLMPSLAVLTDKSLLQVSDGAEGEPRFRWLETIRGFAIDHLTISGELAAARRRHAEHYVALAEAAESGLTGRDITRALDAIDRDYDNFRAVLHTALDGDARDLELGLRLAGALYRFWNMRGHLSEARQWLERALPESGDQPDAVRAKALNAAGVLAGLQADHDAAERYFADSLALWRALGETARVAAAIGNLGQVAQNQTDVERALTCYRESLCLYESIGDVRGVAVALGRVALLERQNGRSLEANALLERSVALFRDVGDSAGLANSLANLGQTALLRGDLDRADACLTESLQLRRGLGNVLGAAECLEGFAALACAQGRPRRAARLCGAADAVREQAGTPLVPADRATHDRLVTAIASRLGEHTFTNEWAQGQAMPFDEAARYALRSASDAREPTASAGAQPQTRLTRREREVVALVARGLTNRQVAERLLVAPRTIETHLEHVFAKLGVQTRAEVAAWAARADALQTTSARTANRVAKPVLQ